MTEPEPSGDPLSRLEAELRLADAEGKQPTYADLADMVRAMREEAQRDDQEPTPVVCVQCHGLGIIEKRVPYPTDSPLHGFALGGGMETCAACEGTGLYTPDHEPR